ncbi:MAG TPA: DUF488 family protein [Gemmatimonadota bacterium]|nr:DUF488 family protein [Gemmatimonadota bacterium]
MEVDVDIKRAYEEPSEDDGRRFLVDRVWPRGRSREALDLEAWTRDVAPSDELRKWFGHDPERWEGFRRRYRQELRERPEALEPLLEAARDGPVTLVYGARDTERNNAVVLRDVLVERLGRGHGTARDA